MFTTALEELLAASRLSSSALWMVHDYYFISSSLELGDERRCPPQELRGIGLGGFEVPEWKTKALGKAPTFGFSDVRPIKEQRESLPIFKLRDQLIEAVNTHQARACCWAHPCQGLDTGTAPCQKGSLRAYQA